MGPPPPAATTAPVPLFPSGNSAASLPVRITANVFAPPLTPATYTQVSSSLSRSTSTLSSNNEQSSFTVVASRNDTALLLAITRK